MKKYLKWVVLLLVCVGIAVSLSNTVSHYSAISTVLKNVTINSSIAIRKIDRLENSAEALSEWYIELKKEIVDLRNEVLKSNAESTKFKGLIMQNRREVTKSKYPSYEYLKSVTVYIQLHSSKENLIGTGVIVESNASSTYILTNAHAVRRKGKENTTLYVKNNNRNQVATIIKIHNKLDLALIKISGKIEGKRAIKGVSIRIKPQDRVYLVGHHLGRKYVYGEGVFAGYNGVEDIVQIPILSGNSGSGVFDEDGKLVSLICSVSVIGPSKVDFAHGIGIDSLNIIHFLATTGVYNGR